MSEGAKSSRPLVLGHLATMFIGQKENFSTEAIGFVLRKSPVARECLAGILTETCGWKGLVGRISNQVTAGEESRPDIGIYDPEGNLVAFLEAKFWAGLTEAQPVEYLKRLEEGKGKALVFLVPSLRVDSLLGELDSRVHGMGYGEWKTQGGIRVCQSKGKASIVVVSWNSILSALHSTCSRSGDQESVADIAQIEGLVREFEADGYAPMSAVELTDLETARRTMRLTDLCRKAIDAAHSKGVVTFENLRWTPTDYGAGRYVLLKKAGCWIGFDSSYWARFQASPLWMRFETTHFGLAAKVRNALQSLEVKSPARLFVREDGFVFVPLFVPPGLAEDAAVDSLVAQIKAVKGLLEASNMPDFVFKAKKNEGNVA